MRTNKYAVFSSAAIGVLALETAIILNRQECTFAANLFSGIFSSTVLAFSLSIIGYINDRIKTLEKFYSYAEKAAANLNLYKNNGDIETTIDIILQIDRFDYLELDNAYGDICFLFQDEKKRKYIYDSIYGKTIKIRKLIREISYHINVYKNINNGNITVMRNFVGEIDKEIMKRTDKNIKNSDGSITHFSSAQNQLVLDILSELGGKYYDLMYPWKKGEKNGH